MNYASMPLTEKQKGEFMKYKVIHDEKELKKNVKKWIAALRSGEYEQTRGALNDENGFCCLGVACDLFIPKNKLEYQETSPFIFGDLPQDQPAAPQWLKIIDDHFQQQTLECLSILNDETYIYEGICHGSFTFDEIADLLQLVYLEGALS